MVKRGSASNVKRHKVIKEYNKCEEQRNKLAEVAKVAEVRNAKLEAEKTGLQKQLEAHQANLQELCQDLRTEDDRVSLLEGKLKAVEEELFLAAKRHTALKEAAEREVAFREATIKEAKLEVMEEFR